MKKTISMAMIFAGMAFRASAQNDHEETRSSLVVGLKAGANYSNVYDMQGENFVADPKFGLAAGAFISIPVGRLLGVQPEILFSQKGFSASGRFMGTNYSFTRTTNYIDVPLLLALKPFEFLTILAGPQYSYLLRQKDQFDNSFFTSTQEQAFENDNLRKNTLCFTGGIDINVHHLVLGARVGWDLQRNHGDGSSDTPRYKNVWYQATIGFRIYNN